MSPLIIDVDNIIRTTFDTHLYIIRDEEYDRGKRKKVRNSKIEFGGPNPFQEIASKKAKVKKASLGRCSSANQPFRIL